MNFNCGAELAVVWATVRPETEHEDREGDREVHRATVPVQLSILLLIIERIILIYFAL